MGFKSLRRVYLFIQKKKDGSISIHSIKEIECKNGLCVILDLERNFWGVNKISFYKMQKTKRNWKLEC